MFFLSSLSISLSKYTFKFGGSHEQIEDVGFPTSSSEFHPPPAHPPAQARPQVHIVGPRQRHHLKKRLFPNGSVQTPFFRLVFNARSRAKLKSHSRFLEVGGINLHSVSLCRASFIHDAMIREAGCPAFSIIIGRDAVLCGLMIQCARA